MNILSRIPARRCAAVTLAAILSAAVSCSEDPCDPCPAPRPPQPIYRQDFSDVVGAEWSKQNRTTSPSGAVFLGKFGAFEEVQLVLGDLPRHTALTLTFKLFVIASWDGNAGSPSGPDQWSCSIANGPTLLYASFSNVSLYGQNFPNTCPYGSYPYGTGASAIDSLGYSGYYPHDAIYDLAFTFEHSASSISISFKSYLREPTPTVENESWGIDDLYLWAGPAGFPSE